MLVPSAILQAAGAALLTPTSLGLILATAPRPSAGTAPCARGPRSAASRPRSGLSSAACSSPRSWRWVFLVNVPDRPGRARRRLAAAAARPRSPDVPRPDALGAALRRPPAWARSRSAWSRARTGAGARRDARHARRLARHARAVRRATLRHRNPLVDPALFRVRRVSRAPRDVLFSVCLRGDAALDRALDPGRVGLVGASGRPGHRSRPADGPAVLVLLAGRLIARFGAGPVAAPARRCSRLGLAWWAVAPGPQPDYVGDMLGGMLLTGVGVGLTLPTLMATAAGVAPRSRSPPARRSSTLCARSGWRSASPGSSRCSAQRPISPPSSRRGGCSPASRCSREARPPLASRRAVRVAFSILGSLEIRHDGQPLELAGTRRRALIAALLLRPNETVSADCADRGAVGQARRQRPAGQRLAGSGATSARSPIACTPRAAATGSTSRTTSSTRECFEAARGPRADAPRRPRPRPRRRSSTALALWRGPVLAELGAGGVRAERGPSPGGAAADRDRGAHRRRARAGRARAIAASSKRSWPSTRCANACAGS